MKAFWTTFLKDLLVLRRDRGGLMVLFLMPMVLVLVVSLVQNNILESTGAASLRVLFLDADGGRLAQDLRTGLEANGALRLVEKEGGQALTPERLQSLVASGAYPFGLWIPAGTEAALLARMRDALQGESRKGPSVEGPAPVLYFDPSVQGVFRLAVRSALGEALLGLENRELMAEMLKMRGVSPPAALQGGNFGALTGAARQGMALPDAPGVPLREEAATDRPGLVMPNAVQQNIPAWSLFGMFFIVVPLAGAFLREKQQGTLLRLRAMPVSYGAVLLGKLTAFAGVCMIQFTLMLLVGTLLLPLLGTPQLHLAGHLVAAYALALCAALAATGYGLLVGAVARTYEQALTFGSVSIVVAAALGGVMVPVSVMPKTMQAVSIISPLAWGLNGFLEIFVRGGGLRAVVENGLALLAFFAATLGLAWMTFLRQSRTGR